MSVAMRLILQLNVILINCFVCGWTQTIKAEVMTEKYMEERNSSVSYPSDPSLTLIKVIGLSRLEFGLKGCSGAKIVLLTEPKNFTDFVEIILGKDDNSFTIISECRNESWCEVRNRSLQRPMYCFGYISFWISFRSPWVAVGVRNDRSGRRPLLLTGWTPPSSTDFQLDTISYVGFTNEDEELSFLLSRDTDINACYVREDEETSIQQCGDNFYDRDLCIQCRCCYQEHRKPSCFYSKAEKEIQGNRCLRSIEELSDGITFLVQTPSYVYENVSFLMLIGTLRPNFTYDVEFEANESTILDDFFELRPHVPHWAYGLLPLRFHTLLNLNKSDDIVTSQEKDYFGVELNHIYNDTGQFTVSFSVSGQLTLINGLEKFVTQALVEVQRRPTLAELINFTWLGSRSQAYSDEKTEFIYLLKNSFPDLSYAVDFGDGSEFQVFNSSDVETRDSDELRIWLFTNDDSFSSINFTESTGVRVTRDFLNWPVHRCLVFDHVYLKPGNYVVSVNVSGYILAINRHDEQITTLSIDVQRRPKLKELVDGLVFVASSPVYDREPVSCAVFVENNHPSLSAAVDFGDESDCRLLHLSQSILAPAWLSGRFLHKAHAMNDSQVQDFLNSTRRFIGNEFNHTYRGIGTYAVTIVISGYHPVVLKSDNVRMTSEIKVESRPTLSQATGRSVLLIESPVYVNETTNFLIGTEYFHPELTYTLDFGDLSSRILFRRNHTPSVSDWNRNGNQISEQGDFFLSTNASNFRLETVKHVFKSVGNYKAMLYISGVLEVVRKCDVVFIDQSVYVQRRPTLSEIVQSDIHMIAKNQVYKNQDANVFFLFPRNLSNLSYAVDCGNGLTTTAIITKPLINLPDWITNGSGSISSTPQPLRLDVFLANTGSFFAGSTSCRYKTPKNYATTLNVFGKIGPVGKVDFHQLSLPVAVISRPTLSMEIGRIWLFVRKPVFVSEQTNCIVIVENYFPKLQYYLSTGIGDRLSNGDLRFSQNLSITDWLQKGNYYASDNISIKMIPNNVYWTNANVTFQKPKAFDVIFNVSGKLETVDRWENVIRSVKVFAAEKPKLSEQLKNRCVILNSSIPVVENILGFVFLCQQILHQEHLIFRARFGDDSPDEMFIMSSEFRLPNWVRTNDEQILQKLVDAAPRNRSKRIEMHEYNGVAFYHMYHTAGKRELRVIVSANEGFRVSDSTEFVFTHQVSIENSSVQPKPSEKCRPYSVSIRGGGTSFDLPGKFGRNEPVRLEAVLNSNCLVTEEQEFVWEIQEGAGNSQHRRLLKSGWLKDPSDKRKLTLDPYSLHYGKYKIAVKVSISNAPFDDLIMRDETWISIEPSALHVELLGGPVVVTDYFREVTLTAVQYEDIDEPPDNRSNDPVFTWFCTRPNEELPQELLKHASDGSGGCFGDGFQIANGSSHSFLFRPDHSVFRSLPAVFIVHVFISKPSRTPSGSQQAVIVLPKGPPSVRIVCVSNCGEFLNTDERLVLSSTCLDCTSVEKLDFLWELEPTCHQNAMKESDWRKELSAQNTANQLVVDPRVFSASAGGELQYRLKVTVTRQDKSQTSAIYTVQTRSQPQANPPSKLSQDAADQAAVGAVEASTGNRTTGPSSVFLLVLLLFSVLCFSRL